MVALMGWSLNIGRLFGIPVRVHFTLLILLGLLLLFSGSASGGAYGLLIAVLLFGSVLVHELGHALVARRYGVGTKEIVLLPIGGAAMLSNEPDKPVDELLIAVAGPLVSLALAALTWLLHLAIPFALFADLVVINLMLGLFNLVPAFPLDGGRMLRAGLAVWMGETRATRVAARVGRLIAIGFVVVGFVYGYVMLAFIGVFVFIAATAEERSGLIRAIVANRSVTDLMERVPQVLGVGASIADAGARFAADGDLRALPVAFGERILGVVHRADVLATRPDDDRSINDVIDRGVVTYEGDAPLLALLTRMGEQRSRAAVIVAGGDVIGVLTVERILDEIRAARHTEF